MGEYEGTFVSWNSTEIFIDAHGTEESWQATPRLALYLEKADIRNGDAVTVTVEFETYKATHIVATDLQPRALLARITELEQILKNRGTS